MCAFVYNCATYVSFMHQFTHWLTHTKRKNECVQTNVNGKRERKKKERHIGRPADRQTLLFKMCNIVGTHTRLLGLANATCTKYTSEWRRTNIDREIALAERENWQPNSWRKNHLRCVIHLPKKEQMCAQSCLLVLAHSLTHSRSFANFVRQLLPSMN